MIKTYTFIKSQLFAFVGFISILTFYSNASAQVIDVQVGTQTGTASLLPITSCFGYSYTQQIYLASDLVSSGMSGITQITAIRFYYASGPTGSSNNWTVYLGNSAKTSFESNSDWENISNLTQVFSGNITYPAAGNWMQITFSTPYLWDGTSNLVIAVDENQIGWNCSINWRKSDLGTNRGIYFRDDVTNPNPASPPSATGRVGYVPNIQFVGQLPVACAGAPAFTTILSSAGNTLCENDNTVLSLNNFTGNYFLSGLTYQWQSFDGTNWVDINGANSNTYEIHEIDSTSNYQIVIGCSNTGDETILAPILINVDPKPDVSIDIDSCVTCPSTPITLTASGATTYAWSPASGLSATNTASVNASPANSTVYTVTGTDANGCTATAQSAITTYASVKTDITTIPFYICEPNLPVSVEIITPPSVVGGIWEYRFLNADGTTEIQTWSSINTYNYTPTADSVYTFYGQLRNTACGTAVDSVEVKVVVGFGGDVSKVDYDCINLGGTINVMNAFGQVEIATLYDNAFVTASDSAGVAMTGAATISGGRLVLTPSATGSSGAASFNATGNLGINNSLNVSFSMTMDTPINVGADGIAYSFGNDVLTTAGSLQNGRGSKLRLSFDAIDNSGSNGNIKGAYLVYGWTSTVEYGPASNGVLAFNPNTSLWFDKTDVLINLSIDATGNATVTADGQVLFSNVQMPAAYMNADVSTWKHHFGAQTGAYAFRQAIDNVKISKESVFYGISQGTATTVPTNWQSNFTFTDLDPGIYHVWLAHDSTAACSKRIETIEILNTNPLVDLGADTTICAGESLTLDAGNPGSTYVWSGTNSVAQTLEVNSAGTYTVYATAANGCFGIGNINVIVNEAPTATGIYRQGVYPNFIFTVLNSVNADTYNWSFGDGTILTNAPATVSHYYTSDADVTVTASLTNECGSTTVSQNYADLSIASKELEGLQMYPNPATEQFTISLKGSTDANIKVVSTIGAIVMQQTSFSEKVTVDTKNWESGIYFVTVSNKGLTITEKLIVK